MSELYSVASCPKREALKAALTPSRQCMLKLVCEADSMQKESLEIALVRQLFFNDSDNLKACSQ
jgi:hypothetical protein